MKYWVAGADAAKRVLYIMERISTVSRLDGEYDVVRFCDFGVFRDPMRVDGIAIRPVDEWSEPTVIPHRPSPTGMGSDSVQGIEDELNTRLTIPRAIFDDIPRAVMVRLPNYIDLRTACQPPR